MKNTPLRQPIGLVSTTTLNRFIQATAALLLLIAAGSAAARQEKIKVCHVDSETGNVNLIMVSPNSNHLENPAHYFDGLTDYDPATVGASGEGTADSNGDGIDDGCEPSGVSCPCFDANDLTVVDSDNQNSFNSCNDGSNLPMGAVLSADAPTVGGLPGFYWSSHDLGTCGDNLNGAQTPGAAEIDACIDLIVAHCIELGTPIDTNTN